MENFVGKKMAAGCTKIHVVITSYTHTHTQVYDNAQISGVGKGWGICNGYLF